MNKDCENSEILFRDIIEYLQYIRGKYNIELMTVESMLEKVNKLEKLFIVKTVNNRDNQKMIKLLTEINDSIKKQLKEESL